LSFVAWLLALVMAVRLFFFSQITTGASLIGRLDGRVAAWAALGAGVAELLGNVLFITSAFKTRFSIGAEVVAIHGEGLVIAMACGLGIIVSSLLLLTRNNRGASSRRYRLPLLHLTAPLRPRLQLPCPE
jgi:hypothetical protein